MHPSKPNPSFPTPVRMNGGRLYFDGYAIECYIRALAGLPPDDRPSSTTLISAKTAAERLAINRRTLGRRVAEAAAA